MFSNVRTILKNLTFQLNLPTNRQVHWFKCDFNAISYSIFQAHNFDENQEGMKMQLHQLTVLLKFIDPLFYSYLGKRLYRIKPIVD